MSDRIKVVIEPIPHDTDLLRLLINVRFRGDLFYVERIVRLDFFQSHLDLIMDEAKQQICHHMQDRRDELERADRQRQEQELLAQEYWRDANAKVEAVVGTFVDMEKLAKEMGVMDEAGELISPADFSPAQELPGWKELCEQAEREGKPRPGLAKFLAMCKAETDKQQAEAPEVPFATTERFAAAMAKVVEAEAKAKAMEQMRHLQPADCPHANRNASGMLCLDCGQVWL